MGIEKETFIILCSILVMATLVALLTHNLAILGAIIFATYLLLTK